MKNSDSYAGSNATNCARAVTSRSGTIAGALLLMSVGLAGCESGSSILGSGPEAQPETKIAQPVAAAPTRISLAPVIGAPDGVAKQLFQDVSTAIGQKNVTVVAAQDKADYSLRGYVVAAKDKAATKVSYIWDVTDPAGRRVNRITGEEVLSGTAPDPWGNVTAPVSQAIAQKSATSLASWLSAQSQERAAVASAGAPAPGAPTNPTAVGAIAPAATPVAAPVQVAAAAPVATPAATQPPMMAVVPSLTGASGDGNKALANALQAELSKNGVNSSNAQGPTSYKVEGVVKMGEVSDGKQPVQIDWNVRDPHGKRLGTVTQKNEIVAGSLDSVWGRTADAAAAAAAQGILKLLPKATASN